MSLSDAGLRLHPFQPYPQLEGFWSFSTLLQNGWESESVTYASVRPNRNAVEFQLYLLVGHHRELMPNGIWPSELRPHANTNRIVTINQVNHVIRLGTLGQFRLESWTPELEGERLIGDFTIPRRAV